MGSLTIAGRIHVLSPLTHFGDTQYHVDFNRKVTRFRRIRVLYGNQAVKVPVLSGNSFRGQLRRLAVEDLLERIGLTSECLAPPLFYLLFSGGGLKKEDTKGKNKKSTIAEIVANSSFFEGEAVGVRQALRKVFPHLSVFGCSFGNQILEGKAYVGFAMPICEETEKFTGIKSEDEIRAKDLIEEAEDWQEGSGLFYTRRDDLRPEVDYEENIEEVEDTKKKKRAERNMIFYMEFLRPGTVLVHETVLEKPTEVEAGCLSAAYQKLMEYPYLGGKSGVGHGKVKYEGFELGNTQQYENFAKENKEQIKKFIKEVNTAWGEK